MHVVLNLRALLEKSMTEKAELQRKSKGCLRLFTEFNNMMWLTVLVNMSLFIKDRR